MAPKRSCVICTLPFAAAINTELLAPGMNGRSLRGVASLYRQSHETVRRHLRQCLGQAPVVEPPPPPAPEPPPAPPPRAGTAYELLGRAVALRDKAEKATPAYTVVIMREVTQLIVDMLQREDEQMKTE